MIYIKSSIVLLSLLAVAACTSVPKSNDQNGLPSEAILADENVELSDEALGSIIKDFGQKIGESMKDDVDKLLNDVEGSKKGRLDTQELERFKEANKALSEDTQARIEMAGRKNNGEMTRSIMGDKAQSFMTQVSGRLQSAGAYLGQQMGSLVRMAPKIKGKLRAVPARLRKLMQWPTFLRYKIKFNKVYKSLREELYRQLVYLHTQAKVGVQHLKYLVGKVTHLLKATEFADVTDKEYRQTYNNPQAEAEMNELKKETLDPKTLEHMKSLADGNKNIFGMNMEELSRQHQKAKEIAASRRKRSLEYVDNSELEEDEEMEDAQDSSSPHAGNFGDGGDSEMMDTDEEFKVVDDYAAEFDSDADLDAMDDLDDVIDNALEEPKVDLKPIDLRMTNCVPKPENQDKCGACYAYVTTAAATYYNCISKPEEERKVERMNARFISDCGRYLWPENYPEPLVNGCSGGKLTQAFKFAGRAGGYPFMQYEVARVSYNYKSDLCAFPRPESLDRWAPVPVPFFENVRIVYLTDLNQVDLHLRTVGPAFINLRTWEDFKNQGSGIYGEEIEHENSILHSMWIVGHDKDDKGRDYWILWNSHGTAWGEYGYLRIYSNSLEFYKGYIGGIMSTQDITASMQNS